MPPSPGDFGGPRKGGHGVQITAAVILASIVAVGVVTTIWSVKQQSDEIKQSTVETRAQDIVGAPCPRVSRAGYSQPLPTANVFDFDGVRFGRRFGEADCSAIARRSVIGNGYQLVCQFSSPDILAVKSDKGLFYFEPGPGQEATLFILDGAPRCVLASPYFARWKRAVTETDINGKATFGKAD